MKENGYVCQFDLNILVISSYFLANLRRVGLSHPRPTPLFTSPINESIKVFLVILSSESENIGFVIVFRIPECYSGDVIMELGVGLHGKMSQVEDEDNNINNLESSPMRHRPIRNNGYGYSQESLGRYSEHSVHSNHKLGRYTKPGKRSSNIFIVTWEYHCNLH